MLYEPYMRQQQMTIYNVAITSTVKRLCVASAGVEAQIHKCKHVFIFNIQHKLTTTSTIMVAAKNVIITVKVGALNERH